MCFSIYPTVALSCFDFLVINILIDPNRFVDDMAEVDDDDEEDYDEQDRANANELTAMERCVA